MYIKRLGLDHLFHVIYFKYEGTAVFFPIYVCVTTGCKNTEVCEHVIEPLEVYSIHYKATVELQINFVDTSFVTVKIREK